MEQEMKSKTNPTIATRATNQRTIERAGIELAAAERRPLPPTIAEQIRSMAPPPRTSHKKKKPVGVKSEIKNLGPGTLFFS
jgi:hypothetical protein